MKKSSLAAPLLAAVAFVAAVSLHAQSLPQRVNVPFKFSLMEKAYPASLYYFQYDPAANQLEVLSREKNLLARVPVVDRLAKKPGAKDDGNVKLIFDQVGQQHYLTQVWLPSADGLLIRAKSERQHHATLDSGQK